MEPKHTNNPQNRCMCCGLYFRPDNRVGDRQKSCKRDRCQKKRQKIQQKKWRAANKDYFKGRYEYVKQWRKAHPKYQKELREQKADKIQTQIPPVKSIVSVRLNIRTDLDLGEIQTLVLTLVNAGQSLWVTGAQMHPV
ncbi:MAG: hypothetical protein ACUZ8H_01890 [Candidatus Anammoxibacter sp.]